MNGNATDLEDHLKNIVITDYGGSEDDVVVCCCSSFRIWNGHTLIDHGRFPNRT